MKNYLPENQKINADDRVVFEPESDMAAIKSSRWDQLKNKKLFWLILSVIFFLTVVALFIVNYNFIFGRVPASVNTDSQDQITGGADRKNGQEVNLARRMIDGVFVKEGSENFYPMAVMIENHVDARPPTSLSKANLVFEAEAEGGITRFLAIYADGKNLDEIGPVRSARPYYIDWAREFNALYVHCGGSPSALVKIKQDGIEDLNEFYNGRYFWRGEGKFAPHNVYTSSANLKQAVIDRGLNEANFSSWKYKNDASSELRPEKGEIEIDFKVIGFDVSWKYDKDDNDYERYMAGQPHLDKNGDLITAKNVVIEFAKAEEIDEELRLDMTTIGTGEAVICFDGQCREGEWKKPSETTRTRFYVNATSTGEVISEEAEFNAGTTWVEVVRPGYKVSY